MKDYYKIIGVSSNATDAEIRIAYRALAKKYHPDLHPNDTAYAVRFAEINEAYEVLGDATKRAKYNERRIAESRQAQAQAKAQAHAREQAQVRAQVQAQAQREFRQQGWGAGAGASRMDVMANAMRARMQAEQQAAAARVAQAQVKAQTQGYNSGYTKGFTDAQKTGEEQLANLRRKIDEKEIEINKLELVLREERERYEEQIDELLRRLDANIRAEREIIQGTDNELKEKVHTLTAKIQTVEANLIAEHDKKETLEVENQRLRDEIKKLRSENEDIRAQLDEWKAYGAEEEQAEQLRYVVDSWKEKIKETKKWLKGTYYGELGVYYWSTASEIDTAFEKMKKRYAKKVLAGDAEYKEKLRLAGVAYKTLSNETLRRQYNVKLNITAEDVERARADEHEYLKALNVIKEYDYRAEILDLIDELHADAEAGDGSAANELGEILLTGDGIEKDLAEAVRYFEIAIELGNADGKYNLGLCYLNGEGVEPDAVKGVRLIKEAAAEGSKIAKEFEKEQIK